MSQVNDCLAVIKKAASGFVPQVGMVLGSGLGTFADQVNAIASISFVNPLLNSNKKTIR